MPQQNTDTSKATAKKANGPGAAERARGQTTSAPSESPSYADGADYIDDEGDALGADDVQQGSNHLNRLDGGEKLYGQGRKTREGNLHRLRDGSAS